LLHENSFQRSSRGTPSSSAITSRGSSAAIAVTKSHSPFGATLSTISRASSRTCGSMRAIMRGVKPRFTSLRRVVCRGGSMWIICCRMSCSSISGMSAFTALPLSEEKSAWFFDTWTTSSYRVTAQKPRW
jgi:hypothetical protein